MKFTLIEELLNEVTNPVSELSHVYEDLVCNSYRARGYISSLTKNELKALSDYCARIGLDFDEICSTWNAHHINGLHPKSKNDVNGGYSNVALVSPSAHKYFTDSNRDVIEQVVSRISYVGNKDVDVLIGRVVARCLAHSIDVSTVFNNPEIITKLIKEIPEKAAQFFAGNWKELNKDSVNVIPMELLMSGKLLSNDKIIANDNNNAED